MRALRLATGYSGNGEFKHCGDSCDLNIKHFREKLRAEHQIELN